MAQLTVRNLDGELVRRLKVRAAQHNRSAESEHRAILEAVLGPAPSDFWERAAALREATQGRITEDSTEVIRRDRDRDHQGTGPKAGR